MHQNTFRPLKYGLPLVAAALLLSADTSTWQFGQFRRPANANPVISPRKDSTFLCPMRKETVHWEALHTFNPAAIVRNGKVFVLYRAEDDSGEMKIGMHTSRLGLAESDDGLHFKRWPDPVFFPAEDGEKEREWDGGVEDPRIVEAGDGRYVLTYTQWNHKKTAAAIATSTDLVHWTKHGPALGSEMSYKSAGIVTSLTGGRLIAKKVNGKYWMYWGEGTVRLATSDDLVHWTPLAGPDGQPLAVLAKREGRFDSSFPEVGPPPIWTPRGIVVLYNGKNAPEGGSPSLAPETYAVGEALFALDDPSKLLERLDDPIFKPELAFERSGQYAAGTTFAEGLVYFKKKWFLYYGCADSLVGVAVAGRGPNH
ncbi:glycoside hydrolase family 130 protein [Paludibaculum fermentans]|uniref:Pesticidal protein Cry15Aa n=1 Tax=Paludibaculum fermentans TaxID=1473598 RepID=A0A7S7NVT2_PALFE|nr:glycoside hydrolase family 130 protein [Paludibaculum fermentans]QOY90717.1 pesticidal protein Cry15Aa [Paludibaculum fermentans]